MSDHILEACGQIKEILVKTEGTVAQKLLAICEAAGITDKDELAALLGVTERYVRANRNNSSGSRVPEAEFRVRNNSSEIRKPSSVDKKVSPTPPSKNNTKITPTIHHAEREDGRTDDYADCKAAFNGSTEAMLAIIEAAMGGNCRPNAAQWLANLVRINGQQAVAEAYQKFLTARAEGNIIARPLPWLDTTAKSCKRDAAKAAPKTEQERSIAAITEGMVRNLKPAPGSVRMPEVARA